MADADDQAILTNTPAQAESLLHCLKPVAGDIDFYVNPSKTELMCFKQEGAIFTLRGKLLKLVDQFTYLGSNILSIESDAIIRIGKAWKAIDSLLIIWKSDLSDKI